MWCGVATCGVLFFFRFSSHTVKGSERVCITHTHREKRPEGGGAREREGGRGERGARDARSAPFQPSMPPLFLSLSLRLNTQNAHTKHIPPFFNTQSTPTQSIYRLSSTRNAAHHTSKQTNKLIHTHTRRGQALAFPCTQKGRQGHVACPHPPSSHPFKER